MPLHYTLDDYDVDGFQRVAADFGRDRFGFVVTPNVDHVIRFRDEPSFRALYADAAYVLLDSRFLSYVFRIVKGIRIRVCPGSDLTARLFERVIASTDKIVLIGGSDAQAASLVERYGLSDLHHYNPPMGFVRNPEQLEHCLRYVETCSPFRFCFLAVGSPQQEVLAERLKARGIARGLAFCVGASINFLTGVERRAPLWMQHIGMEWLYRLANDPTRLARRYLIRGPRVFAIVPSTEIIVRPRATPHAAPVGTGHTRGSV